MAAVVNGLVDGSGVEAVTGRRPAPAGDASWGPPLTAWAGGERVPDKATTNKAAVAQATNERPDRRRKI